MKKKFLVIILLLLVSNIYSVENYDNIKIHLVTFGPGNELFLRWGHFGVLVDYLEKRDVLFDYGNFSFEDKSFYSNFIKGIMTYSKCKKYADRVFELYKRDNRTIILQELNLSNKQKEQYIERLNYEVKPQNMHYQYDHYYNNCVSEMINYLDILTDGAFYQGTNIDTSRSFRNYSRDYVYSDYISNIFITLVLGSKVDHSITLKESLFLPYNTMKHAEKVSINTERGLEPLVKETHILNQSKNRDPVVEDAKPRTIISLLWGIVIAILYIS